MRRQRYAAAAEELLRRKRARRDFLAFLEYTFPNYRVRPHHRLMSEKLEAVAAGEVRRLMIFVPPQYGKSTQVSQHFPAYVLGRRPETRVILTSYAAALAESHSKAARGVMMGEPYGRLFGRQAGRADPVVLDEHSRSVSDWALGQPHRGRMRATGVGGGITGFGADLFIVDDPLKDDAQSLSEAVRESQKTWYASVADTRLSPDAAVVITLTRWHEDDIAGWLLRLGDEDWEVLRLPGLAETQAERDKFAEVHHLPTGQPDPLGREAGAALDPEQHSADDLKRREKRNARVFASIWQQRPRTYGGDLIKGKWFRYLDVRPKGVQWIRYWDFAYTAKEAGKAEPDFTAGALVGWWQVAADDRRFVIADIVRAQVAWHDAKRLVRETAKKDGRGVKIRAEQKGNQKAAVSDLITDPALSGYSVRGVSIQGDKLMLAQPWIDRAETGAGYLVQGGWNRAFVDECEAFPNGRFDDQIDAVSGGYHEATNGARKPVSTTVKDFGGFGSGF